MWCDDAPPTPNREPLSPSSQNKKQLLNPTSSRGDTRLKSCGFCSFCSFCSFCQNLKMLKNVKNAKIFYTKIFNKCPTSVLMIWQKKKNFPNVWRFSKNKCPTSVLMICQKQWKNGPSPPREILTVLKKSATRCQILIRRHPIDSQTLTSKQICKHLRRATRSRKVTKLKVV